MGALPVALACTMHPIGEPIPGATLGNRTHDPLPIPKPGTVDASKKFGNPDRGGTLRLCNHGRI